LALAPARGLGLSDATPAAGDVRGGSGSLSLLRRHTAFLSALLLLLPAGASSASIWPSAERRAERELSDPDVRVRRRAARALGELPRSAGRRLALAALGDTDAEVRVAAVENAVALGAPELGARLSSWLTDPETRIRLAAAEALNQSPSAAALPGLARASSDPDAKVRASVARALGASGSADAVVPLLGRLDDAAPDVRREVVAALGHLGDRRAVVPLLGKVEDSASSVRRAAAAALGRLGDARAVSALVLVLRDADESVRVAALEAVGRLGDASAVSSVVAVLGSAGPAVRSAAAVTLARLATPPALAALVAELARAESDPEPVVRALRLAGPAVLPALRACIDAGSPPLAVDGCTRALGQAGDGSDAARVRTALDRGVLSPLAGLPALGELGGEPAVPAVLEALASSDEAARRAAEQALLVLLDPSRPDGRAVDPLLSALRAPKLPLAERAIILRLLGRTGAERVAPELVRVVRDANVPSVVAAAIAALGDIGAGRWENLLVEKLDDEVGAVRLAAALALRRIASARLLPVLLDRLERAAGQDRIALGIALPGAAGRTRDPKGLARVLGLLARSRETERDALLEAIAEMPGSESALAHLAREPDAADRRKLAEALSGRASGRQVLAALTRDQDSLVRATAAWSLGFTADKPELAGLMRLFADTDPRVAANAATSLGRAATRAGLDPTAPLCELLTHRRALVRASALTGLRLAQKSCSEAAVVRLLDGDPSPRVRLAAAALLATGAPSKIALSALERCAADDESGEVAARCAERPSAPTGVPSPVLVFVVPAGADTPLAGAPFALRLADGSERFGGADRRGAVYERRAPAGALELGVPPAAGE
jgi:HEAT repeat protein